MICVKCLENKEESEFSKKYLYKGKVYYHKKCKKCYTAHKVETYWKNPNKFRKTALERWRSNKTAISLGRSTSIKENRVYMNDLKAQSPCADCGLRFHPVAMDFDHREFGSKKAGVAFMVQHGYSLEAIKEEISKCDIVCSNCHRVRTWVNKTTGPLSKK